MRALRDLSVREKSAFALVSSAAVGLVVALLSLVAWETISVRPRTLREAMGITELLARHLEAPLAFDDPPVAKRTLATLHSERNVVMACVYDRRGRLFASYVHTRRSQGPCPERLVLAPGQRFERGGWTIVQPIRARDDQVGTLHLRAVKPALVVRVASLLPIFGVVILALAAVSLWLSTLLGRVISRPLLQLARAATQVSERHDYTVRLPVHAQDEVGQVTEAFNRMLVRIQEREGALARANQELQGQIAERQRAEAEREQLLEDLQLALRVRDEFLSVASHELRTPISTLLLQAGALERIAAQDAPLSAQTVVNKARVVVRQGERLERLVATLLDVSRIMAKKLVLTPEQLDLTALIEDNIQTLRTETGGGRLPLSLHTDGPALGCWDRLRLEQVITNLIGNAVKYGEGKPVEVRIETLGERVRVIVRDQGLGIAPENIDRIFGRFERAVSERHYGGFGLGLWIVRQIVDAMHGRIWVESTPGQGSTFIVELPRKVGDEQTRDGGG